MEPKSIEDTYKKLTQREHVLHRPNMYIGEINKIEEDMWVIENGKMIKKKLSFSPGFLKIFDEVLTNALDHGVKDETLTRIEMEYKIDTGEISIYNNGNGIPVVIHKEHNMYVPELIFGNLLSGSNYTDSDKRVCAGTNGLGSKLCTIYSKKFIVETIDSENKLRFYQEFHDNMTKKSKAKVTKNSKKSFTKITMFPDYERFSMNGLEPDTLSLLIKRMYDCIACTSKHVNIYINGEKLKGKGLMDYSKLFVDEEKIFYEDCSQTVDGINFIWEYSIIPWDGFCQVSFVNGNNTYHGGKHVDYILNQITYKVKSMLETKKKLTDVKLSMIKESIFIILRATVINPQFSSQTKDALTTQSKDFGCKVEVSEKMIGKIWKSSIVSDIVDLCKTKEKNVLSKTDGKRISKIYVNGLEDALWAGTSKSNECVLMITEGLSAKTFAMWGRSIVGAERYGAMPLKGKILNTRDATISQLSNNEELNNLKKILGLKQGKVYENTNDLRYGKVLCCTDQDLDGSHIKGLFINFIHDGWPSLIKLGFIQTLNTPIIKATKGKTIVEFFNQQDHEKWQKLNNGYKIKYYKGLGTSSRTEAIDIFKRIKQLQVDYIYRDNKCDDSILLAFDKDKTAVKAGCEKKTDQRKMWLSTYDKNSYIDMNTSKVTYQDFIHKDLIHFSIYDNLRSIPNICDGFKPSQRKVLHYMLSKNITNSIKVAQLSGFVAAAELYHHGENSLQQTIIGMAQSFTGSNNINLLFPEGNFGTRLHGGKDSASARYIFTYLSKITQHIFHNHDNQILTYLNEEDTIIEPEYYVPVIPMILVNGCSGIGTGFSTSIPPHNPRDIIKNIELMLDEKEPIPMLPYFNGFNSVVEDLGDGKYCTKGKWKRTSPTQIEVTDLPIDVWVSPYKEHLESMIESNHNSATKKQKIHLKDVKNLTRDENTQIRFVIDFKLEADLTKLIESKTLERELKLIKNFNTNNMYLFNIECVPTKYATTVDILKYYFNIRLDFYKKRKLYLINKLKQELIILKAKVRFITEYISGKLDINNKNKQYCINLLSESIPPYPKQDNSFDFLINMPMSSVTSEKLDDLKSKARDKKMELDMIIKTNEKDMWKNDLIIIKNELTSTDFKNNL